VHDVVVATHDRELIRQVGRRTLTLAHGAWVRLPDVLRALGYFIVEAGASIWRGGERRLAIMTIAAGLFLLDFLVVNSNLGRLVSRWTEAAEMSVYLATTSSRPANRPSRRSWPAARSCPAGVRVQGGRAGQVQTDFSDLRASSRVQENPLPASFEVRLQSVPGQERPLR